MLESQVAARARRQRLWNPAGGRRSSELEIRPEWAFRREQAAIIIEARRAQQDFERRQSMEDALRQALEERAHVMAIARQLAEDEIPPPLTIQKILITVARYTGLSTVDIQSARRNATVVRPRQIVMFLGREHTLLSLPAIGRRLGRRDHTTILHGHRKIKSVIEAGDVRLAADIDNIKWELGIR
jgi:chromosomal replication initiation ATPase DnaA